MLKIRKIWLMGLLLTVFIGPIVAAITLYFTHVFIPTTNNYGQLIMPPRYLGNALKLKRMWYLIYITPADCDKICVDNLYKMQQIRLTLGKDMKRVERMIITLNGQSTVKLTKLLSHLFEGTIHTVISRRTLAACLTGLSIKNSALLQGGLYLVDPMGNLMMHYPTHQTPKGIYHDLKRLLSVSQIG